LQIQLKGGPATEIKLLFKSHESQIIVALPTGFEQLIHPTTYCEQGLHTLEIRIYVGAQIVQNTPE
jgi:hypothetical protein